MKNIFTSIDIGSSNVKVVVCELLNNKLNLIAASSVKSKGIKKGLIVNPEEAVKVIDEAIKKAESMVGFKITKVIASIPSYNADFTFVKGAVNIVNEEHVVGSNEVVDVITTSMESALVPGKEMVTIVPIDFKVDKEIVDNPIGHKGDILSTRGIMVTVPRKNIASVYNVLGELNIDCIDIMINGIGNICSFKNKDINSKVGVIVDMGAETSTISVYNKSIIIKNDIVPVGANLFDVSLSKKYNISVEDAKKIKEEFGFASTKYASVNEFYDVTDNNGKQIKINQYEIAELISDGMDKLLDVINKEISILSEREIDYIIFTGGLSEIAYFTNPIHDKFANKASVGMIKTIGVRNNMYSAALGNIIYFVNKMKLKGKSYSMVSAKDSEDLSSVKKNNANVVVGDSMLGKVAQYFFGE